MRGDEGGLEGMTVPGGTECFLALGDRGRSEGKANYQAGEMPTRYFNILGLSNISLI